MATGLWFCEIALKDYQDQQRIQRLRLILKNEGLHALTFNGFPQGDFHQPVVKEKVYLPPWDNPARLHYTIELANLLAALLPEDLDLGSISTLPLAYRHSWNDARQQQAIANLVSYVEAAKQIEAEHGKRILLCLEMEPGCVLERSQQCIRFFEQLRDKLPDVDRYVGLCFDICHQAVMQENICESVEVLDSAGITLGKVQVSSAIHADCESFEEKRAALKAFAEPKYLHQVSGTNPQGRWYFADDLPDAFQQLQNANPWWIHYHVPIQLEQFCSDNNIALSTTQHAIVEFFRTIARTGQHPHVEIETYTWQVLPESQRPVDTPGLVQGLCAERAWLVKLLTSLNLLEQ